MLPDELTADIFQFREDRDWQQFHSPRNLAMAISVEAAELLEPFRWASDAEALTIASTRRTELSDEIADLVILLTYMAKDLHIDIPTAVATKLKANAAKYPVDQFRGSSRKYTELP